MNFPEENEVFQRPCCSVLLPSYRFATSVLNQYARRQGSWGPELVKRQDDKTRENMAQAKAPAPLTRLLWWPVAHRFIRYIIWRLSFPSTDE